MLLQCAVALYISDCDDDHIYTLECCEAHMNDVQYRHDMHGTPQRPSLTHAWLGDNDKRASLRTHRHNNLQWGSQRSSSST